MIISHPFRIAGNGTVATVEQFSDQGFAEQIAVLLLTKQGERLLVPGFGLADPVGHGVEPSEVIAGVAAFGPDVTIGEVTSDPVGDGTVNVTVTFGQEVE